MSNASAWAHQMIEQLLAQPNLNFVSQHVDEILGQSWSKLHSVELSHAAYAELIQATAAYAQEIQASLVFPLAEATTVATTAPHLDRLAEELRDVEPPGLYLARRSLQLFWNNSEEYRIPVEHSIHNPQSGAVKAYYRCYRHASEIANGWEYSRALNFDHYTNELLTIAGTPEGPVDA